MLFYKKRQTKIFDYPSYPPDLNPIMNIWEKIRIGDNEEKISAIVKKKISENDGIISKIVSRRIILQV